MPAGQDVLQHGEVPEEAYGLERAGYAEFHDGMRLSAPDALAVEKNVAALGDIVAGDAVENGGLARAVGADEPDNGSPVHGEIKLIDGHKAAKDLAHAFHFKKRTHDRSSVPGSGIL